MALQANGRVVLLLALVSAAASAAVVPDPKEICTHNLVGTVQAVVAQKGRYFIGAYRNRVFVEFLVTQAGADVQSGAEIKPVVLNAKGTVGLFLDPQSATDREMLALLRSAGESGRPIRVVATKEPASQCGELRTRETHRGHEEMYLNVEAVHGIFAPRK